MHRFLALVAAFILPLAALAGGGGGSGGGGFARNLQGTSGFIIYLIDSVVVPLIFAVAFIVFLWGVYTYFIQGAGNEEKRKEGRNFVIYGIIGFFVMVSVWGLVNIFVRTFGFDRDVRPPTPRFGPVNSSGGAYGGSGGLPTNNGGGAGRTTSGGTGGGGGGGNGGGQDLECGWLVPWCPDGYRCNRSAGQCVSASTGGSNNDLSQPGACPGSPGCPGYVDPFVNEACDGGNCNI